MGIINDRLQKDYNFFSKVGSTEGSNTNEEVMKDEEKGNEIVEKQFFCKFIL